jgi:hypothetical protein
MRPRSCASSSRAPDVGAIDGLQRRTVGQQGQQPLAHPAGGMALGPQRRLGAGAQHALVFQARGQAVTPALQRLHPHRAFATQPQRQAGARQAAVGGVDVHRLQRRAARTAAGHGTRQQHPGRGWDLELQLGLVHGGAA